MRPRAVFFDLDDTLIDRAEAFTRYVEDLIVRHPAAFAGTHRHAVVAELREWDARGSSDRAAFSQQVTTRYPGLELTPEAFWEDMTSRLPGFVVPYLAPRALVMTLGKQLPVTVVTNGSSRMQRQKLAAAKLDTYLPEVFISGEVGKDKPDPFIFGVALAWAERAPEDVLHVGDDPERDIAGAARMGLATCWVSHGRQWPRGLPTPTFTVPTVVGDVRDIQEVLAQWT
ncbi:HAD family hydrolase [Pyxidicoccus xibeiensis]|uniref:HAD family hydrolase n=1 Tax=Pyxidicoccus xibeiensis TaxID=2906759 RepID=UPI0020A6FCC4|nr:HAD family hydrolase [Pyxidicoccus xibeiensis]MCP3142638.1 HAD family hydrolase [Pyxidicoccus xibeiensis]